MEHGPISRSVHAMITVTNGTRAAPIVRVPWNVHRLVKPVLDAGATGIIFPMIRSAADAEEAVRRCAIRRPANADLAVLRAAALPLTMQTYADPADEEILYPADRAPGRGRCARADRGLAGDIDDLGGRVPEPSHQPIA